MTVTSDQIDAWRAEPSETPHLEFKEAKTSFNQQKLHRYCVALGNEGGGHLVLGVADQLPRQVVGTTSFPNTQDTQNGLFNKLGFRVEVYEVNHSEGRIVVFKVPARPRGTAFQLDGAYWMRSGESLVVMTEDKLRSIFSEGEPDWLEEISLNVTDAQSLVDLLDTQTFFELIGTSYPSTRDGVIDKLLSERLVIKTASGFSIKRLGGILLAKRLSDFDDLNRKAPRVIVYSGSNKLNTRLEKEGSKGYAVGFQGLVSFVMNQLPQNEILKDALRTSSTLLPEEAIRELIANALIHQEFTISGAGPLIEIYENRLEISNPGTPLVPIERFIDGYQSRNERLSDLMRRMNICEERSSGVDRVIHETEICQLPAPEFRSDLNRTTVVVHGPRPFDAMSRTDRVRACFQHCALRWVMSEQMTNETLRERFGLSKKQAGTASQIISATTDSGQIKLDESVGASRKYARYVPCWA